MINAELWKAIPGYDDMYDVSNCGRVRSWYNGRYGKRKKPRPLKQYETRGYIVVSLRKDGQAKSFRVHRLVLRAFTGPCPVGLECCHNDGDKANNRLENLRWDTRRANMQDAALHGWKPTFPSHPSGEAHYKAKLTKIQVTKIRQLYAGGGVTQTELARQFGVAQCTIGFVTRRETWAMY